jgi:1,4-dihydroxy-2-naphthoyl-CoA hydrolase
MVGHVAIAFTTVGDDFLEARMPVDQRTLQPYGIMHGGASCVLAETVGSTAGLLCLDPTKFYCVGLAIETHHIRSATSGYVTARATPIHLGKTTQLWNIDITDEQNKLVSTTRLTLAVRPRSDEKLHLRIPEG